MENKLELPQSPETEAGDRKRLIIGGEKGLSATLTASELVAGTDLPVLLLGETGSGKEVVARFIHEHSKRAKNPFVRVNCGAISPQLIDSQLFGHAKGAFTGAVAQHRGWFERAHRGTLLLDEIGELSEEAQIRLLRVLNDGLIYPVGSESPVQVNVRIIAATHKDLRKAVANRSFREDLWYRIGTFPVQIPALRDRVGDIPDLARFYVARSAQRYGIREPSVTTADIERLALYDWPGNIRELIAVIERAVLLGQGRDLKLEVALGMSPLSAPAAQPDQAASANILTFPQSCAPRMLSRAEIESALEKSMGRIEGPFGAAKILNINPNTLRSRIKKLGLQVRKAA